MVEMEDRLRLRSEECDLLRGDLRASTEELVGLQKELRDYREKISSLTSEIVPLRHGLKTSEKKRELLESQVDSFQKNLLDKKNELTVILQEYSEKSSTMEIKLRGVMSDLDRSRSKQESSQDLIETQNERIEGFIQKISDLEASNLRRTAQLEQTIDKKGSSAQQFKHLYEDAIMKIEALEQGNTSLKEESLSFEDRMRDLEMTLEESRSTADETIGKLSSENSSLLKQIKKLEEEKSALVPQSGPSEPSSSRRRSGVSVVDSIVEEGVIDSHELYEHLNRTQMELSIEKNKRKEAEQYLSRIHKDIELKGPIIAKMKNDHSHLLHERDALNRQMESVLKENSILRDHISSLENGADGTEGDFSAVRAIHDQNKDLAAQVTALLARSQGEPESAPSSTSQSSAADVISAHLVPYDSVQQLQQRNMQLLQVVRRLAREDSKDVADNVSPLAPLPSSSSASFSSSSAASMGTGGGASDSPLSRTLSEALEELKRMRESRAKAEAILIDVMRERDELKSVISPAVGIQNSTGRGVHGDKLTPGKAGANGMTSPLNSPGRMDRDQSMMLEKATAPLQAVISQLENRLNSASQRIETYQKERVSAVMEAEATVSHLRQEASAAKQSLSVAESKVLSLNEQGTRLQSENSALKSNLTTASARLLDTERNLEEERREHLTTQTKLKAQSDDTATAEDALKFLQLELELAQAAEASAMDQLAVSEQERRHESTLLASVQRMEKDFVSKREGDLSSVLAERDSMGKELAKARKELLDAELMAMSRVSRLEEELKKVSVSAEEKIEEAAQLRLSYTKQEAQARAATDRLTLVEKQLGVVQERMVALQGAEKIEEVLAREGRATEQERDEALRKLEQAQQRLQETQTHMEYFRKIGLATDEKMKTMRALHEEQERVQQKALEDGDALVQRLQAQIGELRAGRDAFAVQQAAFAEYEKEQEAVIKTRQEDTEREARAVREEVSLGKQREESQKVQISHLQQLADTLAADLESIKTSSAALKAEKEQESARVAQLTRSLQLSEGSVADMTANAVSVDLQHKEALSQQETVATQLKQQEQDLRRSNDLLHAQLQTLGARISRYEATEEGGSAPVPIGGMDKEELDEGGDQGQGDPTTATSTTRDTQEELAEGRQSIEELRELVWLLKRERDTLETRVSTADRDHARASAALNGMQKSLEEARTQLRRESERRAPTKAEADFQKLISEVSQLTAMQEQLAEVKRENQRLTHINSSQFAELTTLRSELSSTSGPKDAQISKLVAAKAALETRLEGLQGEKTLWTQRLQQLFDRYRDVDPEEFTRLQTQVTELTQQTEEQKQRLEAVTSVKESVEKVSESLRNKMRQLKTQAQEQLKRAQESHQAEVAGLSAQLAEQAAKLAAPAPAPVTAPVPVPAPAPAPAPGSTAATDNVILPLPAATTSTAEQAQTQEREEQASGVMVGQVQAQAQVSATAAVGGLSDKQKDEKMQLMKSILKRSRSRKERAASMEKEKEGGQDRAQETTSSTSSLKAQPGQTDASAEGEGRPTKRSKREEESAGAGVGAEAEAEAEVEAKSKAVEKGDEGTGAEAEPSSEAPAAAPGATALEEQEQAKRGPETTSEAAIVAVESGADAYGEGATAAITPATTTAAVTGPATFLNPFFAKASPADATAKPSNPFASAAGGVTGGSVFGSAITGTGGSSGKLSAGAAPFSFKPSGLGSSDAAPLNTAPSSSSTAGFSFTPGTSIFGNRNSVNPSPTLGAPPKPGSSSDTKPVMPSLLTGVFGKGPEAATSTSLSSTTSPFFAGFAGKAATGTTGSSSSIIGDGVGFAQQQSLLPPVEEGEPAEVPAAEEDNSEVNEGRTDPTEEAGEIGEEDS